ncbi:MAG TPA: aspartate kinase [Gammaproteobacteria bacterium]|jgi:aspartokinase/homoserine dehydrogenase 1
MSSVKPLSDILPAPAAHAGPVRRVQLLLAGFSGRVGGALLRLIATERARLAAESCLELHVSLALNRSLAVWRDPDAAWRETRLARRAGDWPALLQRFSAPPGPKLLVDCTASAEVAEQYLPLLRAGVGVITANKIADSGSSAHYRDLRTAAASSGAPYRNETTAGAALPLLAPFADLRASGDEVRRVEAVLSGTLSFVFQRLNAGLPFSAAVREARELGYAEPHPAEDLKAQDSARKLLILLREAGMPIEPGDISVQGLSPASLDAESDPERYLAGLEAYDQAWGARVAASRRQDLRLVCLAEYDGRGARIGVTEVPAADPFAGLGPGENLVRAWTRRYQPVPLSIAGPGAGTEVTAGGLLTDILKAATLSQRSRAGFG